MILSRFIGVHRTTVVRAKSCNIGDVNKPAYALHHGDCLKVLKTLPDNSVHAVVTDPPYGLSDLPQAKVIDALTHWLSGDTAYIPKGRGMMGHEWDRFVPPPAAWVECLRVLKPGGFLAVFAGTRTVDLMAMSLRIAGADIRDQLSWIYGSGMPVSLNVGKALAKRGDVDSSKWEGFNTGMKPASEPIILSRKPLDGTVPNNVSKHGAGALNVDACRVPVQGSRPKRVGDYKETDNHTYAGRMDGSLKGGSKAVGETTEGRFPANVILDEFAAKVMDEQSGVRTSGKAKKGGHKRNAPSGVGVYGGGKGMGHSEGDAGTLYGDSGGASRYFNVAGNGRDGEDSAERRYTSKGGTNFAMKPGKRRPTADGPSEFFPVIDAPFKYASKAPKSERPTYTDENGDKVWHSTVKPLGLLSWLCKLICPPGGTILEPFAGSGTTLEAALMEGFSVIGIEQDVKYIPLIEQRIARVKTISN